MQERRVIPRWKIAQGAVVHFKESLAKEDCRLEDINMKGMCISSSEKLEQESGDCKIDFELRNYFKFNADIKLCWRREVNGRYYYGVMFNRVMEDEKDEISRYILKYCSDQVREKWWDDNGTT